MTHISARQQDHIALTVMTTSGKLDPSIFDIKFEPQDLYAALYKAVSNGHLEVIQCLVDVMNAPLHNDLGGSPIQEAARQDRPDIIDFFVKHGVSITAPNIYGVTPLQAAQNHHAESAKKYIETALSEKHASSSLEVIENATEVCQYEKELQKGDGNAGFLAAMFLLKNKVPYLTTKEEVRDKVSYYLMTAINTFIAQKDFEGLMNSAKQLDELTGLSRKNLEMIEKCIIYLITNIPVTAQLTPLNHLLLAEVISKHQDELDDKKLEQAKQHVHLAENAVQGNVPEGDRYLNVPFLQLRKEIKSRAGIVTEELVSGLHKDMEIHKKTHSRLKFFEQPSIREFDKEASLAAPTSKDAPHSPKKGILKR